MATEEDISNNLVYWAKLFNASTWEEFKDLAKDNKAIEEVGNMIFTINSDDQTKEILEGQRRYREQMASQYTAGYTDAEEKLSAVISEKDALISEKDALISEKDTLIAKLQAELISIKDK